MKREEREAHTTTSPPSSLRVFLFSVLLAGFATSSLGAEAVHELSAPEGFHVERFADDALAHDILTLTFDARGRVVVSGPGYVRILLDEDNDGRADRAHSFAAGPSSGAQGMHFVGNDLYCVGDGGILRYRDDNGDDLADGPPERLFSIRTGGEHHAHALRLGPDGWWYLLVGNDAGVTTEHAQGPSPVKQPEAGALLRFPPDFSSTEVYADGYRNAYDFDFHPTGDIFVWDSDGERDVSLPWYQPTRVFHALPGSSAGWLSRSWKRPDYFCDMQPVLARLGRGSPTGVVMYRHTQFPEPYRSSLFVADWTFGRVFALPLRPKTEEGTWTTEPITFLQGQGAFGFAPTDLDVGLRGDLYVSVGGRGTRGGVYRIWWDDQGSNSATLAAKAQGELRPPDDGSPLRRILSMPQPLSSWARANSIAEAQQLPRELLAAAVADASLPLDERIRAVELLTECFGGLDAATHDQIASAPAVLRARAAWSIGRTGLGRGQASRLEKYLRAPEAIVVRSALESRLTISATAPEAMEHSGVLSIDTHSAPAVRLLAAQLPQWQVERNVTLDEHALVAAEVLRLRREVLRPQKAHLSVFLATAALWPRTDDDSQKLEMLRVMQLALGDVGPGHGLPAVYDGYVSGRGIPPEAAQTAAPLLERWFPTGNERLDYELARVISMLAVDSPALLGKLVSKLTDTSAPLDDLHYLIAASRVGGELDPAMRDRAAEAFVMLEAKLTRDAMRQDRNWVPRVSELYAAWNQRDAQLTSTLVASPHFGHPGHVLFVAAMSPDERRRAVGRFAQRAERDTETPLTSDVARLLLEAGEPAYESLVRERAEDGEVHRTLIRFVAERPHEKDRPLLLEGLRTWQPELVEACLEALNRLPPERTADELSALVMVMRTWSGDPEHARICVHAEQLLARATGEKIILSLDEAKRDPAVRTKALREWEAILHRHYPAAADVFSAYRQRSEPTRTLLDNVAWETGRAEQGAQLFVRKSCNACHRGSTALGPDLAGVTRRFSREDLFTAIFDPDRDVSPRYGTTVLETRDGHVYQGAVIYDSVDGVTLLTGQQETIRVDATDLAARRESTRSLMPAGLLDDASAQDLADLFAYLETLTSQ